jgi:hypothetical protein
MANAAHWRAALENQTELRDVGAVEDRSIIVTTGFLGRRFNPPKAQDLPWNSGNHIVKSAGFQDICAAGISEAANAVITGHGVSTVQVSIPIC